MPKILSFGDATPEAVAAELPEMPLRRYGKVGGTWKDKMYRFGGHGLLGEIREARDWDEPPAGELLYIIVVVESAPSEGGHREAVIRWATASSMKDVLGEEMHSRLLCGADIEACSKGFAKVKGDQVWIHS
jgi:hypothetical protein